MPSVGFFVPGLPIAQPRAKTGLGHFYTPGNAIKEWKRSIVLVAKAHQPREPIDGPILVRLVFIFPRPQRLAKVTPDRRVPHIVKPDRDNLDKAFLDALTTKKKKGAVIWRGWWDDDCRVYGGGGPWKFYGMAGEPVGLHARIRW